MKEEEQQNKITNERKIEGVKSRAKTPGQAEIVKSANISRFLWKSGDLSTPVHTTATARVVCGCQETVCRLVSRKDDFVGMDPA